MTELTPAQVEGWRALAAKAKDGPRSNAAFHDDARTAVLALCRDWLALTAENRYLRNWRDGAELTIATNVRELQECIAENKRLTAGYEALAASVTTVGEQNTRLKQALELLADAENWRGHPAIGVRAAHIAQVALGQKETV